MLNNKSKSIYICLLRVGIYLCAYVRVCEPVSLFVYFFSPILPQHYFLSLLLVSPFPITSLLTFKHTHDKYTQKKKNIYRYANTHTYLLQPYGAHQPKGLL